MTHMNHSMKKEIQPLLKGDESNLPQVCLDSQLPQIQSGLEMTCLALGWRHKALGFHCLELDDLKDLAWLEQNGRQDIETRQLEWRQLFLPVVVGLLKTFGL